MDLAFGNGGVDLGFVTGEGGTTKATAATTKVNNIHNTIISCNDFNQVAVAEKLWFLVLDT